MPAGSAVTIARIAAALAKLVKGKSAEDAKKAVQSAFEKTDTGGARLRAPERTAEEEPRKPARQRMSLREAKRRAKERQERNRRKRAETRARRGQ